MHFYSIFLSTLFLFANGLNVDRQCGQDLSNLWLDVVIVVDTSRGMTNSGLVQVASNIATVFSNTAKIGTGYADPRSTQVGLVRYSNNATVAADLDKYKSIDDLINGVFGGLDHVDNTEESYLADGLYTAMNMLNSGKARPNFKKLIIVYASTIMGTGSLDPVAMAKLVKESGISIATVSFPGNASLCEIANPKFCFSNSGGSVTSKLQTAMLEVNCFCPSLWTQYRENYQDVFSYRYGVCNRGSEIISNWIASKYACQNLIKNGHLATEFSQHKHDFLFQVAQNISSQTQPYGYHIGLNYVNGGWYWQQPSAQLLVPLDNNTTFWNPGYPSSFSVNTGVMDMQSSSALSVGWQNINPMHEAQFYMCEVASCDTDNYCF